MFHANAGHEKHIITNMKVIESRLQLIMGALAAYLSNKEMERNVWDDICTLEKDILQIPAHLTMHSAMN